MAGVVSLLAGPAGVAEATPEDARRLATLADRASAEWLERQTSSGHFVDSLTGEFQPNYGTALIGYGLLRAGLRRGDERLVESGVRAVDAAVLLPAAGRGVFLPWAVATARNFAVARLSRDPAVRSSRRSWDRFLTTLGPPRLPPNLRPCHASTACFHNHELVDAVAGLELLRTGLTSERPAARLADRARLRRHALALIQEARNAIGARARSSWLASPDPLGLLSDSGNYPLGYHVLSTALLARAAAMLGRHGPRAMHRDVLRLTDTLSAFMSPDGDVSYMGRPQREAWPVAATVYAGFAAAGRFASRAQKARSVALAHRAISRLQRLHLDHEGRLSPLPRRRPPSGVETLRLEGVNGAGVAIWALNLAADEARRAPAGSDAIPADRDGWFLDDAQARLAVVRRGPVWFAVHGRPFGLFPRFYARHRLDIKSSFSPAGQPWDLRYDFGLVALKWRAPRGGWHDLIRPRPLPVTGLEEPESAGPVLVGRRQTFLPVARRMRVGRAGVVSVEAGFRSARGRRLDRRVRFRFRPLRDGVTTEVPVRRGDTVRLRTYLPAATARITGERAFDATSVFTVRDAPAGWVGGPEGAYTSCCDDAVTAASLELEPAHDRRLLYSVRRRRVRPPRAATPPAGADGAPSAAVLAGVFVLCAGAVVAVRRRRRATGAP